LTGKTPRYTPWGRGRRERGQARCVRSVCTRVCVRVCVCMCVCVCVLCVVMPRCGPQSRRRPAGQLAPRPQARLGKAQGRIAASRALAAPPAAPAAAASAAAAAAAAAAPHLVLKALYGVSKRFLRRAGRG
jgi:predicted lipid-binding transport protein (Tim44 family)